MKKPAWSKWAVITVIFLILSCVTVNIYFPAKEVEKAADEIVKDIRGPLDAPQEKQSDKPQSFFDRYRFPTWSVSTAYAQEATKVNTPTIRAIKDSLKKREPMLTPYYNGGNIGEDNSGHVAIRSTDGLNLKQKSDLNNLVSATNLERDKLYSEVAKALNVPDSQIAKVRGQFAEFWQQYSRGGWLIQGPDGNWRKK